MAQQLSLWQEEETVPAGHVPVPAIGGTIEKQHTWADGKPTDLERLAKVTLGSLETIHHQGQTLWFRVIATYVKSDHVLATWRRIEPVVRGYASIGADDDE